jgi:hypothetical protein
MGYAPPEHRRFRGVVSYFYYGIVLKKHGFKSKPHISVRMRPLVQVPSGNGAPIQDLGGDHEYDTSRIETSAVRFSERYAL